MGYNMWLWNSDLFDITNWFCDWFLPLYIDIKGLLKYKLLAKYGIVIDFEIFIVFVWCVCNE